MVKCADQLIVLLIRGPAGFGTPFRLDSPFIIDSLNL